LERLPQHPRPVNGEDQTNRLYQWLGQRASFFRFDRSGRGSHTIRTEVTVQHEAVTLLVGDAAAGFDTCPLCGNKLDPEQAETTRLRLPKGPISA
jgi:hypothetical protein